MLKDTIKIVSTDMFQTLADVTSRKQAVWRTFLKEQYTDELADEYWAMATQLLFEYFEKYISKSNDFVTVKTIFCACLSSAFSQIPLDFNPEKAADVLAYEHSLSHPYEDAPDFLKSVGKTHIICLSSDTDNDMLGPLTDLYDFDTIFTSETLKSYKLDPKNRFFSSIVEYYNVEPNEIFHIGDSASDIIGAKKAGIHACWLNRSDKNWSHHIKPDTEVTSLAQAAALFEN